MMKLVIAEKPSVGLALAKALGVTGRKKGYIEGDEYIVSWCVGHLMRFAKADSYDQKYKEWNIDDLPIIPENWIFDIAPDKNEQFSILRSLMNDCRVTEVINACDAGREGELIFRLVYNKAGCQKPIKRLWISSMEEKAILDGFADLKDGKDYDKLYNSALCRAKADWIVGINATRLFSRLYNRALNVGRVQTPTLAMICERENEIANFKKKKYFNVHIKESGIDAVKERINSHKDAEKIRCDCDGKQAHVYSVKTERKVVNPPKLYDLTTLQRDANRLYGFTAQQTLDYTQSLYEMKLCTYPRTDSCFLTEDMKSTAETLADMILFKFPHFMNADLKCDVKKVLDNKKVTDHTAIIPTLEIENTDIMSLPQGEYKILCLIANRMLCAITEPYIYETVTAEIGCGDYSFTAKGRKSIKNGFKDIDTAFRVFQQCSDDNEKEDITLSVSEGQTLNNIVAEITEHYTQAPKHYTEDTLLSAMERAGTDKMTEAVEHTGIGTPSTRAAIIEKLVKFGFIKRKKRNIVITDRGTDLISVIPEIIKSPEMTADWENTLSLVAQGRFTPQQFMADIGKLTSDIVDAAKSSVDESKVSQQTIGSEIVGICPRCGKNVIITHNAYACEDGECGFVIWKNNRFFESSRKKLTKEIVEILLKSGKVAINGLYSPKARRNYDAVVCLDDTGEYVNFKLKFKPRKVKGEGRINAAK